MTDEEKNEIIKQFLNDPLTIRGRDKLWGKIRQEYPGISRRYVAAYLKADPVQQTHAPLKRRITTRPIIVKNKATVAQIDLVDFQKLSGKNKGYRYFLSYVDLLSKYAALRPIKNKTQINVTNSLLDILQEMPEDWRPRVIQADNGSEFSSGMERALAEKGIKLIHSQAYNPRSQGSIERLNKTVKQAIFQLMSRHNTHNWVQFLEHLQKNINTSKHESTGYTPLELMEKPLSKELIEEIHARMARRRPKHQEAMHHEFKIGDIVRVALVTESSIRKQTFRKKIMNNWSSNVYKIYSISQPTTASTQPQYLLINLETNRKSTKRYWGYQLSPSSEQLEEPEVDEPAAEEENDNSEPELEPAPVEKRPSRAYKPSAAALRNLQQARSEWGS